MLANRYELVRLLGRGGMGEVWQATDQILKRTVAVKLIRLGAGDDDNARARFAREAQACAGLSHPNVVTIHDFGLHDDFAYMVMECLPGPDLGTLVRRNGPLPIMDALRFLSEAASGLAAAHAEGILHRDVKPANMMLTKAGSVKVLDFGIAALADDSEHLTATAQVIGTFSYLAPERAMGGPATVRSDLYSLGCMAVALLTGKPPFEGTSGQLIYRHVNDTPPSLHTLRPDAPAGLVELVNGLLAKDPGRRPASASDVADRLDALRWPTGATTLSGLTVAGATSATALASVVLGDPTSVSPFAPPTGVGPIDRTVLGASLSRPEATHPASAWAAPPPTRRRRRVLVGGAALVSVVAASVFGLVALRPSQATTAVPGLVPSTNGPATEPVPTNGAAAATAGPTNAATVVTTTPPPTTGAPVTTGTSTSAPVAAPPAGTTQPATTTTQTSTTTQTTTTSMPATTSTTTTKVTTTTTTTKPATTTTTTTTSAPAPRVSLSKGQAVNTSSCIGCSFIVATTSNFPSTVSCTLYWEGTTAGSWAQGGDQTKQTQYYYGYPGRQISVTCNGVTGTMVWY